MARSAGIRLGFTQHYLVKSDTYQGMEHGDTVFVEQDPDDQHHLVKWIFMHHVTNVENGRAWIDLWGGPVRHEGVVSVRPNRVKNKKLTQKRSSATV